MRTLLITVAIAIVVFTIWRRFRRGRPAAETFDPVTVAARLKEHFDSSAHPKDLLSHQPFVEAARRLAQSDRTTGELLAYASGANAVVACIALEAISQRDDDEPTLTPL